MLRVSFVNWWYEPDKNVKNWFIEYMNANFNNVVSCKAHENPDILFSSVFDEGKTDARNYHARIKVFFSGECCENKRYKKFNDKYLQENFDLILHFTPTDLERKYLRFPLWLLYVPKYNMDNKNDNIITYVEEKRKENMNKPKKLLGSCVARHDPSGKRSSILGKLSKYGVVGCPGRWPPPRKQKIGDKREDKIKYISETTYNICAESHKGLMYCSEKIFEAYIGGTIPIYWSNDGIPEKDILERNSYCLNDEEEIRKMMENNKKYKESRVFKPGSEKILHDNYYGKLKSILIKLLRERNFSCSPK
jgi:hypothetical protein